MEGEGKKGEETSKKIVHTYPLVRVCDMVDEMRVEVMELCVTACEKHSANNEMAAKMIKENMDKKFGPSWHAVVGEGPKKCNLEMSTSHLETNINENNRVGETMNF